MYHGGPEEVLPAVSVLNSDDTQVISVLVVDDHMLLANSVMRALHVEGFETSTVQPESPTAVLEAAAEGKPAVVLLDLDFGNPTFSGLDLIHPLTALDIAVVVLTGWQDRLLTASCLELGAVAVVCKSAAFASVVHAVESAANGVTGPAPVERDALRRELREHRLAHAQEVAPFEGLSFREREVLGAMVAGQSATTIAETSFVSISTVRSQIRSVLQKLHVNSQLEAVASATRCGWSADRPTPMQRYSSTLML
jgi:two-component system nitrate/nitrite response regulator NarL